MLKVVNVTQIYFLIVCCRIAVVHMHTDNSRETSENLLKNLILLLKYYFFEYLRKFEGLNLCFRTIFSIVTELSVIASLKYIVKL